MARDIVCDFCSAPEPTWTVPCRNFQMGVPEPSGKWNSSTGDWLACQACARLVRLARPVELARRSVTSTLRIVRDQAGRLSGGERRAVERTVEELHERFWSERDGPPRPLTEGELADIRQQPSHFEGTIHEPPRPLPVVEDLLQGRNP